MESFTRLLSSGVVDVAACIRASKRLGVDAVELTDTALGDDELPAISEALKETELHVCCHVVHCDFVDPDPNVRRKQVAKVKAGLEKSAGLRAPALLVTPGEIRKGVTRRLAQAWFQLGLRDCIETAEQLGVHLLIENVGMAAMAYFCGTTNDINSIYRGTDPRLGTVYDVGNYVMSGEDPLEAISRLEAPISHVHFKDWNIVDPPRSNTGRVFRGLDGRDYVGAVLGEGIVDLRGALAILRSRSYAGYISIEYEGSDDPESSIARAVSYLSQQLVA